MANNKRHLTVLIALMLSTLVSNGQRPALKVFRIPAPAWGQSMEYRFPQNVSDLITAKMDKEYKRNVCMEASFSGDTVNLFIYTFNEPTDQMRNHWDTLLQSTNRYWAYRGWKIPLFFETDRRFSFINWSMNDGDYLSFICRDWTDEHCIIVDRNWH